MGKFEAGMQGDGGCRMVLVTRPDQPESHPLREYLKLNNIYAERGNLDVFRSGL